MSATLSALSVDEIIARLGAQSTCDAGLTQDPWHFDTTKPSYGPGASMLDKLPPLQQTILRLRHIDGMEIGEIATLLHKEEAAVRQNLSRGRKTLRLWIIKKMKEEEI